MGTEPRGGGRHRGKHRADDRDIDETVILTSAEAAPAKPARNVPQALAVGFGLAVLAVAPLVWYRPAFVLLIAAAVVVSVWELAAVLRTKGVVVPVVPLAAGGAGTMALLWFTGAAALLVGVTLTLVAAVLWRMADGPVGFARDIGASIFVTSYVVLLAGFVVLLLAPDDGAWRVVAYAGTTVCSDTGGLIAGSLFGRHKLAPKVSPNKSWEGFAGSMLLCMASGVVFLVFALEGTWWQGVVFGAVIAVVATLGDLAESLIKRDLGVKDMAHTLPAHGGFMDRFDSLLLAAPAAYAALTLFVAP